MVSIADAIVNTKTQNRDLNREDPLHSLHSLDDKTFLFRISNVPNANWNIVCQPFVTACFTEKRVKQNRFHILLYSIAFLGTKYHRLSDVCHSYLTPVVLYVSMKWSERDSFFCSLCFLLVLLSMVPHVVAYTSGLVGSTMSFCVGLLIGIAISVVFLVNVIVFSKRKMVF